MSKNVKYNAIIRGSMGEELVWIDFQSKAEKWAFMKENLPDAADFFKLISSDIKMLPPVLQVKRTWLFSLKNTQTHEQEGLN